MHTLFSTKHLLFTKLRTNQINYFTSSRSGPLIKCYSGVNDGLLYPLPDGVFFVGKPYTFVTLSDMAGLECNKGGSGRTIDLNIHTHDSQNYTFGMIEKEEMQPLQNYIQMILKRAQKLAAKESATSSSSSSSSSSTSTSTSTSSSSSSSTTTHTDGKRDSAVVINDVSDPDEDMDSEEEEEEEEGEYLSEGAAREWSTVVDISIPPPSFKPVSLSLSRSPLSKTPKQVFFNPIKYI